MVERIEIDSISWPVGRGTSFFDEHFPEIRWRCCLLWEFQGQPDDRNRFESIFFRHAMVTFHYLPLEQAGGRRSARVRVSIDPIVHWFWCHDRGIGTAVGNLLRNQTSLEARFGRSPSLNLPNLYLSGLSSCLDGFCLGPCGHSSCI